MNKLEEYGFNRLERMMLETWGYGTFSEITLNNARKAAKIALELAEKAYYAGQHENPDVYTFEDFKQEVL